MDDSARQIRQRIFWIVVRAFVTVFSLALLLVFTAVSLILLNTRDFAPPGQQLIINRVEGYYLGQGGWQGVATIFSKRANGLIDNPSYLLDATGHIVLDHGAENSPSVGTLYSPGLHIVTYHLNVNGEQIGSLVFDQSTVSSRLLTLIGILLPVGLGSVFLTLLATVLVAILSRRIVTPLAEVIAASRAVTAGKLDARVQVQGTEDLLVLTDSFNQMAASLERNDRERRDLLADIAHELRTPLSAIRGRLEGMLDHVYPADEHHISLALKANYLLERLVEDLRLLTLAESRQLHFDKKETDLQTLAAHSVEMFSAEALEKEITLALLPASGQWIANVDAQRTEQVIGNLVSNALRYTPAGGKVWLSLEKTDLGPAGGGSGRKQPQSRY